ncbi:hypothetical protein PTHTG4_31660 [Parageobacillus thermoglucosidasius]|jgi:hypothetical protein|uniref:lasso peptide biosynthesis B2 protein n=1 Tax=Parageobacillus thermoglucosidasius TaxID=1426 RepID=UPI000F623111|nr:lasso peptide biosynthesis B2 protein [Parageobacillus thermoglucosidasius]GCD84101.1 hypothetical protein PTHTG4_31660 [Parageobacillus thermoglucosidasius]
MLLKKILWYIKVYLLVRKLDKKMKIYGFKYVYDNYLSPSQPLSPVRDLSNKEIEFVQLILMIIEKVCFNFFGNARCLHRSVAGYHILLQKNIPIDLVIGVMKKPFMSHAWLEYNGKVINDIPEMIENLTVQFNTNQFRTISKGEHAI